MWTRLVLAMGLSFGLGCTEDPRIVTQADIDDSIRVCEQWVELSCRSVGTCAEAGDEWIADCLSDPNQGVRTCARDAYQYVEEQCFWSWSESMAGCLERLSEQTCDDLCGPAIGGGEVCTARCGGWWCVSPRD